MSVETLVKRTKKNLGLLDLREQNVVLNTVKEAVIKERADYLAELSAIIGDVEQSLKDLK